MRIHILNMCMVMLVVTAYAYGVPQRPHAMSFVDYKKFVEQGIDRVNTVVAALEDKLHLLHEMEIQQVPKERIVALLWEMNYQSNIPPYVTGALSVTEPDATTFMREIQDLQNAYAQRRSRINDIKENLKKIAIKYGIPEKEWEGSRIMW